MHVIATEYSLVLEKLKLPVLGGNIAMRFLSDGPCSHFSHCLRRTSQPAGFMLVFDTTTPLLSDAETPSTGPGRQSWGTCSKWILLVLRSASSGPK